MTKIIRIENAGAGARKVVVFIEDQVDGLWIRNGQTIELDYPTKMAEICIHDTKRLVIEEVEV